VHNRSRAQKTQDFNCRQTKAFTKPKGRVQKGHLHFYQKIKIHPLAIWYSLLFGSSIIPLLVAFVNPFFQKNQKQ
jgi:hypothetical protein